MRVKLGGWRAFGGRICRRSALDAVVAYYGPRAVLPPYRVVPLVGDWILMLEVIP